MPFLSRAPVPISERYTLKICIKLSSEKAIGMKQNKRIIASCECYLSSDMIWHDLMRFRCIRCHVLWFTEHSCV